MNAHAKDDVMRRVRACRGSNVNAAKLTEHDVRCVKEIIRDREEMRRDARSHLARGKELHKLARMLTDARIAKKMGVHHSAIARISEGLTWGHVIV